MKKIIEVNETDFSIQALVDALKCDNTSIGAICSFVGYVRDFGDEKNVQGVYLEHYPGMTETALDGIASEAAEKWSLSGIAIYHRVGHLQLSDQIVLVVCASAHRKAAFAACEYVMDYLKVSAPFWKKEITGAGEYWVEAKQSDENEVKKWQSSG